jgi:hypothetical protein
MLTPPPAFRLSQTQPLTSQTQTLRGEFFMSPEHFQGPAGGVMTQTFERELQKRIEQANPPNEQWHGRWPRTLLCDRYVEVIRAATRNIQSTWSWTPLKSRPSAIGEAACDTRFQRLLSVDAKNLNFLSRSYTHTTYTIAHGATPSFVSA